MTRATLAEKMAYTRPGYYTDPKTNDLWHLGPRGGWSWVNGGRWRFIPAGLVWVDEPNPYLS